MATALANDVISYCTKRGSTVYACSLDAEGAFDAVPHSILFYKAMDVIPDHCWLLLVNWYKSITVQIKHKCELSNPNHGLRFNPSKTECTIFGKCHLDPPPEWRLGRTHLVQTSSVNYLGVTLSHCKPHEHVDKRIIACRRAYFAMQGAGFNNTVTDVDALSYIWKAAIRPILTYGINCINISAGDLEKMEKIQSRLLKARIGIQKFCRSSPFLKALNVSKIDNVIETSSLKLISAIFSNFSRAKTFYCYLLKKHCCDQLRNHNDLIARVRTICSKHNVSLFKYILDTSYARSVQVSIKSSTTPEDGLCDSVRQVLLSRNPYDRYILSLLLKSF